MQRGKLVVQDANDVNVPIVIALMVQATHDVHFGTTVIDCLLAASKDLLVAHRVPLGAAEIGAERTEGTAIDADVRWIEVRVDVVVAGVAADSLADHVRQEANFL